MSRGPLNRPEFDQYAATYEELLKDPIRDRFGEQGSRFFHERKRDLIRDYFRRHRLSTRSMRYLDVGCGRGDLLSLLREDFECVAGCDPSAGMLEVAEGVEVRLQTELSKIPYGDREFDFVTAVCVYHHVLPADRLKLSREIDRVIKPGGVFAIIEHNPYNPVTRLIVSRCAVDAEAVLLNRPESSELMRAVGFSAQESQYFLYLPSSAYRRAGGIERWLRMLPLGGQYAVFGRRNDAAPAS